MITIAIHSLSYENFIPAYGPSFHVFDGSQVTLEHLPRDDDTKARLSSYLVSNSSARYIEERLMDSICT